MESVAKKIVKRIYGWGRGSVFTPTRFIDLGSRITVDKVLSRLTQNGKIQRIARGVYSYPKYHPVLGELVPSLERLSKAIAGRDRTRLQPSGAYAANLLGLSEQVPGKIVFLTDGPSRKVKVGNMEIHLRRTTPRNMVLAGQLLGLVIQSLRYIGKNNVSQQHVDHLKKTITVEKRRTLSKDLGLAPVWMQPILCELAEK